MIQILNLLLLLLLNIILSTEFGYAETYRTRVAVEHVVVMDVLYFNSMINHCIQKTD